jgi:hypothetical protein
MKLFGFESPGVTRDEEDDVPVGHHPVGTRVHDPPIGSNMGTFGSIGFQHLQVNASSEMDCRGVLPLYSRVCADISLKDTVFRDPLFHPEHNAIGVEG